MKKALFIIGFAFAYLIFCLPISGQEEEEQPPSRSITSSDFRSKREISASLSLSIESKKTKVIKRKKVNSIVSNPKRRYNLTRRIFAKRKKSSKSSTVSKLNKSLAKAEELGITFWKLRPLVSGERDDEDIAVFPVRVENKTEKWTAERVSSKTVFKKGDRVRFTIEPSRTGYIYIVNRELYADGTNGQTSMIFPTLRSRGGDNRVQAGSLIEIPSSDSSVAYFNIEPKREDYVGEELIVLILRDQLPDFEVGLRVKAFSSEIVEQWFADWEKTVDIYDAEDGEGLAYSTTESSAANVPSRTLTQEEPLPQTIYKVMLKEGDPLFVAFKLNVEK